ncbi:serine recombinase [Mycobacterium intermedium]|uniref:Serine recombinase n=1 Tax=Mycobacterium intermedium TaxID=28445 RepID=A0A1E3SEX1_MYCIE|nr:recombinase family protein [Mycobacterium intermedium]MCV6963083.1 recombinase family protein [Mycobacterium intermedium]ODR00680.1 serine recombinase [Mycobacterium intermedium]OPE52298.1 serine recombinase [Mycobacterium intermedium]ORB00262.1 serine recombinase [Mycobacterium intermedium]
MRAAVYTRISSDPTGQQLGVTRQLDECKALAERLGWDIRETYSDNDISAYSGKRRPSFERLLTDMKAGQFEALLAWHPDRLYRSMRDLERLIEVADERRVRLRTVVGGDLDLGTSAGRMLGRILGATARQESEHKAERQRSANEQRAAAGEWVKSGQRPFGYTKTGEPLEPEASAYRQAVADVLAGRSLRSISIEWNQRGLLTTRGYQWTNLTLRKMLTNPLHAGLRAHRGKVVAQGNWEPLVDPDTHRGLQAFLSDPSRRPGLAFELKHMGSGRYICGRCGAKMYASYPKGRTRLLYVCRAKYHLARAGKPLDEYMETLVLGYLSDPETRQRLTVQLEGETVDVDGLHTRRAALQARLDELAAMFAAGDIDGSQLKRGTADLRMQLAGVDTVLADLARKSPAADLITAGDAIREHWDQLTPDLKGKVLQEICTVTVKPIPPGLKWFTAPDGPTQAEWERFGSYLDIEWK